MDYGAYTNRDLGIITFSLTGLAFSNEFITRQFGANSPSKIWKVAVPGLSTYVAGMIYANYINPLPACRHATFQGTLATQNPIKSIEP